MKKSFDQKEAQFDIIQGLENENCVERESLMRRHEAFIEKLDELMTEFSETHMPQFAADMKQVLAENDSITSSKV